MSIRAFATKTLAFSPNESLFLVLFSLLAVRTPLKGIETLSDFEFQNTVDSLVVDLIIISKMFTLKSNSRIT